MVDKYCWLGPGANKPFDSIISDWKISKLTKRSICVLQYIKKHDYNIFMWYRLFMALTVLIMLLLK